MCGIAGVMSLLAEDLRPPVLRMLERLRHRGPDGEGLWLAPSGRAALAHARLSVFDPSSLAAQPMSIDGGRLTVTYNGALYNLDELRDDLRQRGATLRTQSDTEVIVKAYQQYGADCVDRFRGMFAVAIWDEREQTGFLARDPFGMKPLYYASRDGRLIFGSELRSLAASRMVRPDVDAAAVFQYFQRGSVPEPRTLLDEVKMLPAGATAFWQNGTLSVKAGCDPLLRRSHEHRSGDAEATTRETLLDSVARHFAGDTEVGLLLSSGADSAAILSLATRSGRDRVHTFSLSMPASPADEGADAATTAAAFNACHHSLAVDAESARAALPDYARAIDQPTIDGLNTYVAARFARRHGIKVVLSGIGADELFGGYGSFHRVPRLAAWHRLAAMTGPLAAMTGRLVEGTAIGPRTRRIGDLLGQAPSLERAHATFRGVFTRREARLLSRRYAADDGASEEGAALPPMDARESVSVLEMTRYVRNQLLRDADVMAMASGVEIRTPFIDRIVASSLSTIPPGIRFRAGKQLLADAIPEIPRRAFERPKRCFQFPFDQWLDREWRDVFAAIEAAAPVPLENWYRKWCVFAMEQALRNLKEARRA